MPRGIKSLIEARDNNLFAGKSSFGQGQFIRDLRLYDRQDFAEIRFITDYEDMYWNFAHRYEVYTPNGTKLWRVRVCEKVFNRHCEHCARNERPSPHFWYWVHVYNIYYSRPFEGREPVKIGSMMKYKQTVNGPLILMRPTSSHGVIETIINTYGTLTDRDYKWIRQGERGDQRTTYALFPIGEPGDPPAMIARYRDKLPDLEDVATGKIEKIDIQEEPEIVRIDNDITNDDDDESFDTDELEF